MIASIKDNKVKLYGSIYSGDGRWIASDLERLDGLFPVLEVFLHTNGGSVFDGNLIYNALKGLKSEVHIYIDGVVASMGTVIMLAGKRIIMRDNAFLMIHAPSGMTEGTAKDHLSSAKLLRSIEQLFVNYYMSRTKKDEKTVRAWLDGDNWFDAKEAMREGLVDEITGGIIDLPEGLMKERSIAAIAKIDYEKEINSNQENEMKKAIITALALAGVTEQSSDTAVIEAVQAHYNGQINDLKEQLKKEQEAHKALKDAQAAAVEKDITAAVDAAIADGRITADKKESFTAIGKASGIEALRTVLSTIPQPGHISNMLGRTAGTGPDASRKDWDWDKWQKEDPRGLEKLEKESPEAFNKLFDAKFK